MNQPTIVSDQTGMAQPDTGMFSGFGVIFRKEIRESNATPPDGVCSGATATLLAAAGPVGYWIYKGGLHAGRIALSGTNYEVIVALPSVILSTLGLFMVIAMTMGIIVREQDLGTLQWVFTKPLSAGRAGAGEVAGQQRDDDPGDRGDPNHHQLRNHRRHARAARPG